MQKGTLEPVLFQQITVNTLPLHGINCSAFVFFIPLLTAQAILIWPTTSIPGKLAYAIVNIISSAEAILHGGDTLMTAPPLVFLLGSVLISTVSSDAADEYVPWPLVEYVAVTTGDFKGAKAAALAKVTTDVSHFGAAIADLSRKRVDANEAINQLDATRLNVEDELQKATLDFTTTRLANEAELTIRTNDLAVFNFILEMVRCKESGALVQTQFSAHLIASESVQPSEVCSIDPDGDDLVIQFEDLNTQAKFEHMMTKDARIALREALGQIQKGSLGLLQGRVRQSPDADTEEVPPNTTTAIENNSTIAQINLYCNNIGHPGGRGRGQGNREELHYALPRSTSPFTTSATRGPRPWPRQSRRTPP
jgi:hypothetical protein